MRSKEPTVRRSSRAAREPSRLQPIFRGKSYAQMQDPDPDPEPAMEYTAAEAKVLAMITCQINEHMAKTPKVIHGTQCVITYSLKKGIQKFGEKGKQAALKEMKQLHNRECFKPIRKESLNPTEHKQALESLIFLTKKKNGVVIARHCANGSTRRGYMSWEEVSSPTVSTKSTLLTAIVEAHKGRDVATCNIPNAFTQTEV